MSLPIAAPRSTAGLVLGRRIGLIAATVISCIFIGGVLGGATMLGPLAGNTDFAARSLPPSLDHPFGTDPFGRDVFVRTLQGLALSLKIGLIAAMVSSIVALVLAIVATTFGRLADMVVSFLVDAVMGLPHLVLLVLICFALGGGPSAVVFSVAVTHWPRLTRILRAEVLQVMTSDYVRTSRRFGMSWWHISTRHLLPHLFPQMIVGTLLLFPHAILHEAGLTFLGFGLEPSKPAIGIMLADSMRYLTAGYWWLGLFPGAALVALVLTFDGIASGASALLSPRESQD